MVFRRIEWIFLITFIMLDIFLALVVQRSNSMMESNSTTDTQSTVTSVLKSMNNDQIKYGNLSNKTNVGYYLSAAVNNNLRKEARQLAAQSWTYSSKTHKLSSMFVTAIRLSDTKKPQKTLDSVVADSSQILHGSSYTYNANLSTTTRVVYSQVLYGKQAYTPAGQIIFKISADGYVTGYTQGYLQNITILREAKKTLSEKRSLVWLYQYNKLAAGSTVKWGDLGYSKLLTVNNNYVFIPTWSFYIRSGATDNYQIRTLNAFTGTVMNSGSDE